MEGEGEDQKLLGEGLLRKSDTKWGGRARRQPKWLHETKTVGQTAWRPQQPTSVMSHDDDDHDV